MISAALGCLVTAWVLSSPTRWRLPWAAGVCVLLVAALAYLEGRWELP